MPTNRKGAPRSTGWSQPYLVYRLRLRGWSLRKLAEANGLHPSSLSTVWQKRRWRRAEQIIADALDVSPAEIWPDRYPPQKKR